MRRFLRLPRPGLSSVLIAAGASALVLGGIVLALPWFQSEQWRSSPEAARAQRNADAPTPIWLTPGPADQPTAGLVATAPAALTRPPARVGVPQMPTPVATPRPLAVPATPDVVLSQATDAPPTAAAATAVPTSTPAVSLLTLRVAAFQFMDPPEPGARARLSVAIHNPTDGPVGPVSLVLPLDWLAGYRIQTVGPAPLDGSQAGDRANGPLRLTFDGPEPQADLDLTVDVVAVDEVIDAPLLRVVDANGAEVGRVQPPTAAPPARPGPIYSIDIPNLHLHAGVVPVEWEPPLFVVGQLRASAYVNQGNSVLVGHVRGAAGYNVFDHLDQLTPGDKVIATSRGETYEFVVSTTQVLPEDDTSPTDSTTSPRLTLMTCAGTWNPLTRDYSDRLWVIAQPPAAAEAAIAAESRPTPSPRPTQISARGGLGNTDVDLAAAFGPPAGESAAGLAVYHPSGPNATLGHRAEFADLPSGGTRRALVVSDVPPADASLSFDAAVALSRNRLPLDAQPRANGPEGNARYVVERFTSAALAAALPGEWFADRHGQPGDLLVVYAKRADGGITSVSVAIGDDAAAVLARL